MAEKLEWLERNGIVVRPLGGEGTAILSGEFFMKNGRGSACGGGGCAGCAGGPVSAGKAKK